MPQKKDEKSYLFSRFGKLLTIPPKTVCALLSALCRCTACVTVAHRWCSVHPSSPGGSHTCPPGRCRGRCSVGDSPSAHILVLSSLPRSDTHRWCISHGYHSPPHTPLLRRRKKKKATETWSVCAQRSALLFFCYCVFCTERSTFILYSGGTMCFTQNL